MTKFTAPQMSVIRFNESDVIVASNGIRKTITVNGVGNEIANDATYIIGNGAPWNSAQVLGNSAFTTAVNEYLGGNYFSDSNEIFVSVVTSTGRTPGMSIGSIASRETGKDSGGTVYNNSNGIFTWNSSTNLFTRPQ